MFVSLFRSFAAANPVKTAVVCRSGAVSYGELELLVRRVSRYLALMGVEQGSRVVMALPSNIHSLVLYHALADSGAVIIPLSRTLPHEAIRECLEDARPHFCLVSGELAFAYEQVCTGLGQGQGQVKRQVKRQVKGQVKSRVVSRETRPYSLDDMFRRNPACIHPLPKIRPDHELMIHYHWYQGQDGRGHWSGVV